MGVLLRKSIYVLKNKGMREFLSKMKSTITYRTSGRSKKDIVSFYEYVTDIKPISLNSKEKEMHLNDKEKILNWIIPEMGKGSGGHFTIFRTIAYLENHGFHCRIYTKKPVQFFNDSELATFIYENYPVIDKNVEIHSSTENISYAHATIATSWDTAYFVNKFDNTDEKFYFVQDFEPYFYPVGSEYFLAENTYKLGFKGITAGEWLKEKLNNEYGMWTRSFGFSYDKDLYKKTNRKDFTYNIFFYSRPATPRRNFEIGVLAFNELCKRMPQLKIFFVGWPLKDYILPFKHEDLGTQPITSLPDIYGKCDMCLVLSGTNLSLMPLEAMAAGTVVVSNNGPNNDWFLNNNNAIIVDNDPIDIANKIEKAYLNKEKFNLIREQGTRDAESTSWEVEGEKVKKAIEEALY